jgi:hypothetical protein
MSRQEQKDRSRHAILASAARSLPRSGIRDSSVGDDMNGAGLTVGGFYGNFASSLARELGPTVPSDEVLKACRALGAVAAGNNKRRAS